ncbi:MAG: hypothetical protein OHK0029_00070 [Armatimonadaceae bacterium]
MKRNRFAPVAAILILTSVVPAGALFSGCGGGGGGSTANNISRTPVRLTVNWAARSRAEANAPASAQSFVLVFSQGNPDGGGSLTFPAINRRTATPAYSEAYTTTQEIRVGATRVNIRFFAEPDAKGAIVAEATQDVVVGNDGSLLGTNGQPANISVGNKIESVEIPAGQSVLLNESKEINFVARDANNATVAVTRGSASFGVVDGNDVITFTADGVATGAKLGSANIVATVDGKDSAAVSVAVVPKSVVVAPNQTVRVGESKVLTVSGTDVNDASVPIPGDVVQLTITEQPEKPVLALVDGQPGGVSGVGVGTAKVRATAYGLESAVTDVVVELGPEVATGSGLVYQEIRLPSTDVSPVSGKRVTLHYVGYLAETGQKFDSSLDRGQPFSFTLDANQVIPGFNEGVKTMKVGGERRLLIPPQLGYGATGVPGVIPPNAELVFDIQLISVEQ